MSLSADDGFRAAVTEGHVYSRQLFLCRSDGTVLQQVPMLATTGLQVGANLVRRSGTLVLANVDDAYWPTVGGLVDFGKAYLLRYGVVTASGLLTCDQPLMYPDMDAASVSGHTVSLPVSDGMRVVGSDAKLGTPLHFVDGLDVATVVRALLVAVGAPTDDSYYDLQDGGEHLVGDHGYEVGALVSSVLSELLVAHALDLWAAAPLVYTLRPIPDPLTATPVATWQLGAQVRLLDLSQQRVSLARNHAIVEGVDPYGQPFVTEVYDRNPLSPVQWGAPGVGDLVVPWKSDSIATPEQARAVGRGLLTRYAVQRTYDVTVPVDPSLDRRDVVRIIDTVHGTDVVGMLDSFPVPSAPGAQTVTVVEARVIDA